MSEFFEIDNWDETEQIEYFENPIYSYLNEDKKKLTRFIQILKKETKNIYKGRNIEGTRIKALANQIQRRMHVSTPDGEPEKFTLIIKTPIPNNLYIDPQFLKFYSSLQKDNYLIKELRTIYNNFFRKKYTNIGFGRIREVNILFRKKQILYKRRRTLLYTKLYYLSINNTITYVFIFIFAITKINFSINIQCFIFAITKVY
ncbi:hypothetical protein M9Y10_018321 [Tritrichomonas musculus]|uniref:Uncharacterized protein n=1 Tax=Tritrichomonas musculus TaxID=1915356 RepID=A0ABR2HNW9_9EUKA